MTPEEFASIRTDKLKMTQEDLATLLGVSTRSIRHWEAGTRMITKSVVRSLGHILDNKKLRGEPTDGC